MKSFFVSVECAERGLNPFTTNLVVAEEARGTGALCLAVNPKIKSLDVKNRCRMFEIPKGIEYIVAKPRMKKHIEYAADIYELYLRHIDKDDIHVYSIDESFIDATDYLKIYHLTAKQFASRRMDEIVETKDIPATAEIGTNLCLAKIALDITAKKVSDQGSRRRNIPLHIMKAPTHNGLLAYSQKHCGTAGKNGRVRHGRCNKGGLRRLCIKSSASMRNCS